MILDDMAVEMLLEAEDIVDMSAMRYADVTQWGGNERNWVKQRS
jgi:hypothetical protein